MKKIIKKLPHSKIEIEVEISADEWENFLNEAAKELSKDLKINGFRPGLAPRVIIEKEIGTEKLLTRASELAVRKTYVKIILDDKIEAIGLPKISILKIAPGNPFLFRAEVFVLPEVKLPDYNQIVKSIKQPDEPKVEDEEVIETLKWLQKSRTKLKTVNREAKEGDRVEIDFEIRINDQKVPNGESKNHPLIIGENRFVKGFDKHLVGMKEGEKKEFDLLFPEDYYQKDLAGREVRFKVKMNLVQEQEIPEINDQFAQSLGNFKDMKTLEESIREGIGYEKEEKAKQEWREKVLDTIASQAEMELPSILIEKELETMVSDLKNSVMQTGLEWDKYLKELKKNEEDLKKDLAPHAEKRIRNALVIKEIAKKEKIKVEEEEIENEINKVLRKYSDIEQVKSEVDIDALKEYTYGVIRNEKVFRRLEEITKNK